MQPVVTADEMTACDATALKTISHDVLVRRAGMVVGFAVGRLLQGVSGRRITVLAGPGSNGADGRIAAAMLTRRGARVNVVGPFPESHDLEGSELIVDAAFGTGLSREYVAPKIEAGVRVVAVDIVSGLNATTGECLGNPCLADLTVTMAAYKSGLLLGHGPEHSGTVSVADIGIPIGASSMALLGHEDLTSVPRRARDANKWSAAVGVVAGSPGMEGAASLCSLGALRAGSGMVRLVTRRSDTQSPPWPPDVVRREVEPEDLVATVLDEARRVKALVVGPGLGIDEASQRAIREIISKRTCPVVLDADGITAVKDLSTLRQLVDAAASPVIMTPHDGELARLLGRALGSDRLKDVREVADQSGVTVLSKGATTLVVSPAAHQQQVLMVNAGTPALATAGTGDVLSGVIAAMLAQGVVLPLAGALGAHIHGCAGARATSTLLASDLPNLVGEVIEEAHRER